MRFAEAPVPLKPLVEYRIPFAGLKSGTHYFNFEAGDDFFGHFEANLVREGRVFADLCVEKRPRVSTLTFDLGGQVRAECDRCTAHLDLPIHGHFKVYLKYRGEKEDEGNEEVILVSPDEPEVDLSGLINEFIQLSLPMRRDCREIPEGRRPCNMDVIRKLEGTGDRTETDPRWDKLRALGGGG